MNPERIRRKANEQDMKVRTQELHRVLAENRHLREKLGEIANCGVCFPCSAKARDTLAGNK